MIKSAHTGSSSLSAVQQTHLLLQSTSDWVMRSTGILVNTVNTEHTVAVLRHKEDASAPRFSSEQEEQRNILNYFIIICLLLLICSRSRDRAHAHTSN